MITKRIIPCLDVRDGRVVKGTNFEGLKDIDDPVELAKYYNNSLADELVFYDITASYEDRSLFVNVLEKTAEEIFIPLTVGGGINSIKDFDIVLKSGADKVSINSGAIKNPNLIKEASEKYGSQCVVLSIDIKRIDRKYFVFAKGGRENTGIDAIEWAVNGEKKGFDIELLKEISNNVSIPLIASGGAGGMEHFKEVFQISGVDGGLAASIFHFKEIDIKKLKCYLSKNGINVRV